MVLLANDLGRLAVIIPFSFSLTIGLGFNTSYSRLPEVYGLSLHWGFIYGVLGQFLHGLCFCRQRFHGKVGHEFLALSRWHKNKRQTGKSYFLRKQNWTARVRFPLLRWDTTSESITHSFSVWQQTYCKLQPLVKAYLARTKFKGYSSCPSWKVKECLLTFF